MEGKIRKFLIDNYADEQTGNVVIYRNERSKAFKELSNILSIPVELPVKPACEIEGRIKEAEYWRDIIFSPEEQEKKQTISLTDFILRIEELKASKSV